MKKYLTQLLMASFIGVLLFGTFSCSKDEDSPSNQTIGAIENIALADNTGGTKVTWDAYEGAMSYMVSVAGIPDSDFPITGTTYVISGSIMDSAEIKVEGFSDILATNLVAEGVVSYSEGGDNGDGGDSGSVDYKVADFVGRWQASTLYYIFKEDKTGESGSYMEGFDDEVEGKVTWEITTMELSEFDAASGEFNDKEVPAIKATDSEGYYIELQIIGSGDTITLKDVDNNQTYKKVVKAAGDANEDAKFDNYVSLPGIIECENYIRGGEGVAYHDTDAKNEGKSYRTGGVDIGANGSGFHVGYVQPGEWLLYNVNVSEAGTYYLKVTYANGDTKVGQFSLSLVGGATLVDKLSMPATSGWTSYSTANSNSFELSVTGQQTMKLYIDAVNFDIDKIEVVAGTPDSGSTGYTSADFANSFFTNGTWEITFKDDNTALVNLKDVKDYGTFTWSVSEESDGWIITLQQSGADDLIINIVDNNTLTLGASTLTRSESAGGGDTGGDAPFTLKGTDWKYDGTDAMKLSFSATEEKVTYMGGVGGSYPDRFYGLKYTYDDATKKGKITSGELDGSKFTVSSNYKTMTFMSKTFKLVE